MNAQIARAGYTLHSHLEIRDIMRSQNQLDDSARVGELLVDFVREIALQAPRVPRQPVAVPDSRAIRFRERNGAKVDNHVFERPALDAAAACAGGEMELREAVAAEDDVAFVGNVFAVTGHGVGGAVEHEGIFEADEGRLGPVPVGLSALVAAFAAQGLLVLPGEIAVPAEE